MDRKLCKSIFYTDHKCHQSREGWGNRAKGGVIEEGLFCAEGKARVDAVRKTEKPGKRRDQRLIFAGNKGHSKASAFTLNTMEIICGF